jgi:hypothetical protein
LRTSLSKRLIGIVSRNDVILEIRKEFELAVENAVVPVTDKYQGEDGIVLFVREILGVYDPSKNQDIAPYQEEILRAFVKHRRVAARGPHGLGKSALASWCILWLMIAWDTDVKVVTTASAWRQLEKYLWPEIHKWARRAKWNRLGIEVREGKELLSLSLKLPGKEAFAAASDHPELIEGAHATVMGYVFDEAKAIPDGTWDAAEGAMSQEGIEGKYVFAIAISTPGDTSGRFYEIHQKKPGLQDWWTRHVTLQEAIAAKQISEHWAEQRRLQWGDKNPVYITRVLGEFADASDDSVIALSWVEASNARWSALNGQYVGLETYGCDIARFGDDKTVLARLVGNAITDLWPYFKQDTMQTVGRIVQRINFDTPVGVDPVGIGAGVLDRLLELGYNAEGVNAGNRTDERDISGELKFRDTRSAIWWRLADRLNPINERYGNLLALPPIPDLTADLVKPKWRVMSTGIIAVETKEEIAKRLGTTKSTDYADAVGIALWMATAGFGKGGGNLR